MSPDITVAVPGFSPAKCLLWRAFVMRVPTLILLVVSGVVLLACAAPEGRSSDVAAIQKESASPRLGSQSSPSARSEEHTSELQSLMRISYAVFCLKKKKNSK